ncbi:MAG: VOC family protein [Alphaproteobacteria bacterium]|jgi:catechol 2,3-dioxygenase-like lactoylglutathione lyase family enzyme|nr:VOC family protein [Alphaproteobacteria bacterium]
MNIHHVSIGVTDLNNSKAFYNDILGVLGYRPYVEKPGTASWKPILGGVAFWINKRNDVTIDSNNGSHIAFEANSQEQVNQFYELAIKAGAQDDGPPALRPEYRDTYYSAFVVDLDGHKIEAVHIPS